DIRLCLVNPAHTEQKLSTISVEARIADTGGHAFESIEGTLVVSLGIRQQRIPHRYFVRLRAAKILGTKICHRRIIESPLDSVPRPHDRSLDRSLSLHGFR